MSGSGWRENQRESRRNQDGWYPEDGRRPNGNRMSVARHAHGKESLWMLFLKKEGYRKFQAINGVRYDNHDPSHKEIMGKYYREMPDEQREAFIAQVDAANSNRTFVLQKKREMDLRQRQERHENTERFEEMRREHLQKITRPNETVALPVRIQPIHVTEDLETFCANNREKARRNLLSFLGAREQGVGSPLFGENFTVQLISVFPLVYSYKYALNKLTCYPAEICVTTFNLQQGLLKSESKFVNLDYDWLYSTFEEYFSDAGIRDAYAGKLGIHRDGPSSGESPNEAFTWLQSVLSMNPAMRLVCDQNQFNFVFYGIKTLATYTGHNAVRFFADKIASQLISIQDFASVILETAPLNIPKEERWTDQNIKDQFLVRYLAPSIDRDPFCSFHEDIEDKQTKYRCVKAQNARLLHCFFRVLRENKLQEMDSEQPRYTLCFVSMDDPDIPEVLLATMISRDDERGFLQRAEEERNQSIPSTSQDGAGISDELFGLEDDSDDDNYYTSQPVTHGRTRFDDDNFISSSRFDRDQPGVHSIDIEPPPSEPLTFTDLPRAGFAASEQRVPEQRVPEQRVPAQQPPVPDETAKMTMFPDIGDFETPSIDERFEQYEFYLKKAIKKKTKEYSNYDVFVKQLPFFKS